MIGRLDPLHTVYHADRKLWEVTRRWGIVVSRARGGRSTIYLDEAFLFNGGSIPRLFRPVIDRAELGLAAFGVHDLLYEHAGRLPEGWIEGERRPFTRIESDALLYWIAIADGAEEWQARLAYQGLYVGGWYAWWRHERMARRASRH